jgi:hypothetical protein
MKAELEHLRAENARLTHENNRGGVGFPAAVAAATGDKASLTGLLHRVNHIAVVVLDAEKSRAFYEVKNSISYEPFNCILAHF